MLDDVVVVDCRGRHEDNDDDDADAECEEERETRNERKPSAAPVLCCPGVQHTATHTHHGE